MLVMTENFQFRPVTFDPMDPDGPLLVNKLHLNSVQCGTGGMHIAGLNTGGLLFFNGKEISMS